VECHAFVLEEEHVSHQYMDRSLRTLPTIRCGISVFWIEESYHDLSISEQSKTIINCIKDLHKSHTIICKSPSKCIRYLKGARKYERIMIIMVSDKIPTQHLSAFNKYSQVQSIFIICPVSNINDNATSETIKPVHIFNNYDAMFIEFQQSLNKDPNESTSFTLNMFHPNGKSLRDVRQNLGPFVWSHSYIGGSC
jgi:hypothetical protein